MKKLLLLLAAICCMMGANAQQFTDANGIKYNVTSTENNTVEVIANGYSGAVVIPAIVTNEDVTYIVTGIGKEAFYYCEELTSVTIPNSVTYIDDDAFGCCDELTSITLPNNLESIGYDAFRNCDKLASITFPGTLKKIDYGAFHYCDNLTSITIPSSVTEIGEEAFGGCPLMASISVDEGNTVYDSRDNCNAIIETATNTLIAGSNATVIPLSVTAIGNGVFEYLTITSITIPSSVKSIGKYAFYSCENLTSITIPSGVTSIGEETFAYCENLTSITIPSGVTSIGNRAFDECKRLASITIPSSVENIGHYAFDECTALESITVLASNPPTLNLYVFYNVDKSISVYVPNVTAYSNVSWGGFTNFQAINIGQYKQSALDEIEAAMEDVSLSEDEEDEVEAYIATIEAVTTLSDENLTIIENAKNAALAVISQAAIRIVREAAIAAIEAAMQGETGAYIIGLAQQYIAIINSATDVTTINNAKNTALAAINAAMGAYQAGKAEAFGTLGTKQNGPAIIVTDQDGNEIILYSPKSVKYIKVNEY